MGRLDIRATERGVSIGDGCWKAGSDSKEPFLEERIGLTLDAGPFVAALEYATGQSAVTVGKPRQAFFEVAAGSLGLPLSRLVMVGDDIVSDVEGAQPAGARGVLVKTGKFRPHDFMGSHHPDAVLESAADLPPLLGCG